MLQHLNNVKTFWRYSYIAMEYFYNILALCGLLLLILDIPLELGRIKHKKLRWKKLKSENS